MSQKSQVLDFLYKWVTDKKIPHLRPGMVEDLDAFIASILSEQETRRAVANMSAKKAIEMDKDLQAKMEAEQSKSSGE